MPVPVSGQVTLDGKPQANVVVQFQLTSGSGLGSVGLTDAQGHFELKQVGGPKGKPGALPGTYRVTFESAVPPSASDGSPSAPPTNPLPASATRKDHTFTVPAQGTDTADFALTSK